MPPKKQQIWPDVQRLLLKRRDFTDLADRSVANSATAFLAWKAFLIVSYSESAKEQDRCARTVLESLKTFKDLWEDASKFVVALRIFEKASPRLIAEWYCDTELSKEAQNLRVDWALRTIKQLGADVANGRREEKQAKLLAQHMYAMRNAVIAHGAVHTSNQLFQQIVPCFERLTCRVTCASYAIRAEISLEAAMEHLGVK